MRAATCSTPLSSGSTKPRAYRGGTRSSAVSSAVCLTVTRHRSTGSRSPVSASTGAVKSPCCPLDTRTPSRASVRAVSSPARQSTRCPARESRAARRPPTPPGPSTAMVQGVAGVVSGAVSIRRGALSLGRDSDRGSSGCPARSSVCAGGSVNPRDRSGRRSEPLACSTDRHPALTPRPGTRPRDPSRGRRPLPRNRDDPVRFGASSGEATDRSQITS